MKLRSIARVPTGGIPNDVREDLNMLGDEGYLVEELSTGYYYLVHLCKRASFYDPDALPGYEEIPVYDFDGPENNPQNLLLSLDDGYMKKVELDSMGTRAGGQPMRSNGEPYTGLWPHFQDTPLPFLAQYELPDGRYVHAFIDDTNYDFDFFEAEDGANCAIIEGGEIPSWIEMKPVQEPVLRHPTRAYAPTSKSGIRVAPQWVQDDYTPDEPGLIFLGQVGATTCPLKEDPDGWDEFMFDDTGEVYIFANPDTGIARIVGASH